ncbi:MAG: hypothetical protein Q8N18_11490 [Opitutaceae bacterium]|nr:hypothetical protein [Opitutaceae bacterium]
MLAPASRPFPPSAIPSLPLSTSAIVLLKRPPSDAFQGLTVFSPEHGVLQVQQRLPKKTAATTVALDLFDEAALDLESSNQGRTWFVKEVVLTARHTAIGRSYAALRLACELAALVARNPVHEESRRAVADLLHSAFTAFARGAAPDLVWLKSIYRFARDEGYPVAQQWLPTLPDDLRAVAQHLLHTPLPALAEVSPADLRSAPILHGRLADYLRGHTEILLE